MKKTLKIAVSSDKTSHLTDFVEAYLKEKGHTVLPFGAVKANSDIDWPLSSASAAEAVAAGEADQSIIFCWTGTGASIAANKVPGIRAALVGDAVTAQGARTYNHANVLVLSIRATSEDVGKEILDAWFATEYGDDSWNKEQVDRVCAMDGSNLS